VLGLEKPLRRRGGFFGETGRRRGNKFLSLNGILRM